MTNINKIINLIGEKAYIGYAGDIMTEWYKDVMQGIRKLNIEKPEIKERLTANARNLLRWKHLKERL